MPLLTETSVIILDVNVSGMIESNGKQTVEISLFYGPYSRGQDWRQYWRGKHWHLGNRSTISPS